MHRLTEQIAPDEIELALTPADVARIAKSGKKVAVIGIENGYPIGTDINRVKEFYDRGGRYMSLAHNGHNQLVRLEHRRARRQQWKWGGLSPLGRQVMQEMNRLGIMVDVSHPSKGVDAAGDRRCRRRRSSRRTRRSATLANVSRNMDDEMLMAMQDERRRRADRRRSPSYIKTDPSRSARRRLPRCARSSGCRRTRRRRGARRVGPRTVPVEAGTAPRLATGRGDALPRGLDRRSARRVRSAAGARSIAQWPAAGRATVKDFVDHIDYAVKLIGIDHVGISSDFDGGGGIDGWNSAAETFNVTLELVRRGYTEEQIGKIWSGNLLRVMDRAQAVARQLQAGGR